MLVYMDNVSYEALMHMPTQDRALLAKVHNSKMEKMKKGS